MNSNQYQKHLNFRHQPPYQTTVGWPHTEGTANFTATASGTRLPNVTFHGAVVALEVAFTLGHQSEELPRTLQNNPWPSAKSLQIQRAQCAGVHPRCSLAR